MAKNVPVDEQQQDFYTMLGTAVVRWNHIETRFRALLYHLVGGVGDRGAILITNLGNVALAETLTAMSEECEAELAGHLKHLAALFDSGRIYRNHYVHRPLYFVTDGDRRYAFTHELTAKGGALKLHQGEAHPRDLLPFINRLEALRAYLERLISEVRDKGGEPPLASLEKPPLPDKLELRRLRLEELRRPPRS